MGGGAETGFRMLTRSKPVAEDTVYARLSCLPSSAPISHSCLKPPSSLRHVRSVWLNQPLSSRSTKPRVRPTVMRTGSVVPLGSVLKRSSL